MSADVVKAHSNTEDTIFFSNDVINDTLMYNKSSLLIFADQLNVVGSTKSQDT